MYQSKLRKKIQSIIKKVLINLNLYDKEDKPAKKKFSVKKDRSNIEDDFWEIKKNENIIYKHHRNIEEEFWEINDRCEIDTLTSNERMYALYKAIKYVVKYKIPGDIVECGVWAGGSMVFCALTLLKLNDTKRKLYLYDTYSGMNEPTERDMRLWDNKTATDFLKDMKDKLSVDFCVPLEKVKENLYFTGYPKENLIFVKGEVENTIPGIVPEKISILRLDTDWYESTYHELVHLFPLLAKHGILLIDDYGYWKGNKEATDKYFKENKIKIFLHRIDEFARLAIKL